MKITRTRLITAGVVLAGAAGAALLLRPKPLRVDAATIVEQKLESTIEAYGRTRVRERYLIVAPVAGRVERINRVEGALVRAGEVIARLAPLPLDSESVVQARARADAAAALVREAVGNVRVARTALEQRRREHSRAARLVEAGAMAPRVLEEAQVAVVDAEEAAHAAEERVRGAEADARQARAVLSARESAAAYAVLVRAPATGRVLRIMERSERIITAGTPLLEIGDPKSLEVVADLLSSDVAAVRPGDLVRTGDWAANDAGEGMANITGRVRAIEPSGFTKVSALGIEEQRVNVIVDLDEIPRGIGDGFRVNLAIVVWSSPAVLAIPRSALLAGERGAWSVFVVRDGVLERRNVRVGHIGGAIAEVIEGLSRGEQVVLFPSAEIREGLRVTSGS